MTTKRNGARAAYVTRDSIVKLLSDAEVARVSTAETAIRLSDGDEYVDLAHLDRGVCRAQGSTAQMSHMLPKKAVLEETWQKIVVALASMGQ